ncbi:MAG: methyltransferase domain-containing protein [Burkholderiales bacterium]|nr:methyltransferase domain-containing protein [Bacteroidia bacterium]
MEDLQSFIKVPVDHKLSVDGIYNIAPDSFNERLFSFLDRFTEIQTKEKNYRLPFHLYEQFPNLTIQELASETFTRKQDLKILDKHFQKYLSSTNRVLEIGGWNGWLTNRLSDRGLKVITVDIFEDEENGLRSKKHYKNSNWLSVQTDLLDTSIYNSQFDMIVFNHCSQFLTDPLILVEKYKLLLNRNGVLLILGNTFYKNTDAKASEVLKTDMYFKKNYDFNIRFYPSKGYFSYEDFDHFSKNNFKFISYKFSVPGIIKKFLKKEKSGILYFINP